VPEAFDLVVKARHQMGLELPFNKAALLQMLQDEGLFVTTDEKATKPQKAIRRYIDGSLTRCWHLPPGLLFDTEPADEG
jgi:hypothetical protein